MDATLNRTPLAPLRDVAAKWSVPLHEYAAQYYGDVNRWQRNMQWKRDTIDEALAHQPRAEAHIRLDGDTVHVSIKRDGSTLAYRAEDVQVDYDDIADITCLLVTPVALTGWVTVRHDVPIVRTGRYTGVAEVAEISYDVLELDIGEDQERRRAEESAYSTCDLIGEVFPHVPPQGNPFGGMR